MNKVLGGLKLVGALFSFGRRRVGRLRPGAGCAAAGGNYRCQRIGNRAGSIYLGGQRDCGSHDSSYCSGNRGPGTRGSGNCGPDDRSR